VVGAFEHALHGGAFRALQADRYERLLLRAFDGAVALSAADAAALAVQAPALPVDVVPSGIDVAAFAPGSGNGAIGAAEPATIAFVGYYKHAPNVDAAQWLVHEILPRVRQQVPAARVRLIGRDAPSEVAALAREGAVEVPGFVEDLAQALAHATVIALPLRQGGGLRGKLLEAWAAGRPVVTTAVACEGFEVHAGEHCLVADDARAFADALVSCLQQPALRDSLARAGRAHCTEHYSVAAAAAAFDGVYERLCARRTP
jgi:glycosyltransferase involved in cell wall biosynthesis